jgi:hypothetical protein
MTLPTSRTGNLDSPLEEGRTEVAQANGFLAVADRDGSSDVECLVQNPENPAADDKGHRLPRDANHHRQNPRAASRGLKPLHPGGAGQNSDLMFCIIIFSDSVQPRRPSRKMCPIGLRSSGGPRSDIIIYEICFRV